MKKNLKRTLITTTASLLTIITLFISGGSALAMTLIGGTSLYITPKKLKSNNTRKEEIMKNKTSQITEETQSISNELKLTSNNQILNLDKLEISPKPTPQFSFKNNQTSSITEGYEEYKRSNFIYELETTEAISQEESINRLVRKRKKETEDKVTTNNI